MATSGKIGLAAAAGVAATAVLIAVQTFDGFLIAALAGLAIAGIGWRPASPE